MRVCCETEISGGGIDIEDQDTDFRPDVLKVDTQFFEQWRLGLISLGPKCCEPSRPQTSLFSHTAAYARTSTKPACAGAIAWVGTGRACSRRR